MYPSDIRKLLLILSILTPLFSVAQDQIYSIEVAGKKVGSLSAQKTEQGENTIINVSSDASYRLFWKNYSRITNFLVQYEKQELKSSYAGSYFNDEMEDSVIVKSMNNQYQCFRYPDTQLAINKDEIELTTANLFFTEPVGFDQVFSERFLEFLQLEKDGDNKYKLHLPDGAVNYYTYSGGNLKEIFIDRTLFNVRIKRQSLVGE